MPQEIFVWQHVCIGEIADFNKEPKYGGPLDPKRILRPAFLEAILLEDKYRNVPRRRQIIIAGARLTDTLNLENIRLEDEFALLNSFLEKGVNFNGLRSTYGVSLVGSNITGPFVMNEGHLGGQLSLMGSKITGEFLMNGDQVGGQLALGGSKITGPLRLAELQIGESLNMYGAQFGNVSLVNVHLGGQFNLIGSEVKGEVLIQGVQIYSTAHLSRGAKFDGPVSFIFSKVGQNVELTGGSFQQDVNFTGTQIDGELRLWSPLLPFFKPASWAPNSTLILRNTSVGAIQDLRNSWPLKLDLTGFTYHNFYGNGDPMIGRKAEWFEGWLGRQASYAPAPYQQPASVLREQGRPDTADEVLYAGKQRERAQSSFPSNLGLTASWLVIGYGYHKLNSACWALSFLVIGFLVVRFSGEGKRISYSYDVKPLAYSFDLLLPIIRLREKHYQIDLNGWVRNYFYLHKIMGYVLAAFLIAWIAGLTK